MSIKITSKNEVKKIENILITIFGKAGIGKTSLGFTANKSLLIDFDGIGAINRAIDRPDCVTVTKWADIEDINAEILSSYNTIIVDTFGDLINKCIPYIISLGGNGYGDTPSIKGWGVLKNKVIGFLERLISYKKDIIILCHVEEKKKGDDTVCRLLSVGSASQFLDTKSTMMGYMASTNKKRTIDFSVNDDLITKDSAEIGKIFVPDLNDSKNHKFMENLITMVKDNINAKEVVRELRLKDLTEFKEQVETLETADDFTAYVVIAKSKNDSEYVIILNNKALSLNFVFNKKEGKYESKDTKTLEK